MNTDNIKKIVEKNNGIITAKEADKYGIDSWYLTDMVRKGELERIGRGIYFDSGFDNYDEMYFFQLQNKVCIYSYQTALYIHGLTERLPYINEVTVYQGYNPWRFKGMVNVHQVKKEWHKLGVVNLIPYNEVEGVEHTRPSVKKIDKFYNYLKNVRKVNVTLRQEKGSDIDGACGQLRQRNKKGDN